MSFPAPSRQIEITPGICGGKPRIAGHRIKVQDIVIWHERMGMSPDEIIDHHPGLTLADVYAALSYYHDRREEIQQQIDEGEAFAKKLKGDWPSLIQKIRRDRLGTNPHSKTQKTFDITPASSGSGYSDTAINHDQILANNILDESD